MIGTQTSGESSAIGSTINDNATMRSGTKLVACVGGGWWQRASEMHVLRDYYSTMNIPSRIRGEYLPPPTTRTRKTAVR